MLKPLSRRFMAAHDGYVSVPRGTSARGHSVAKMPIERLLAASWFLWRQRERQWFARSDALLVTPFTKHRWDKPPDAEVEAANVMASRLRMTARAGGLPDSDAIWINGATSAITTAHADPHWVRAFIGRHYTIAIDL